MREITMEEVRESACKLIGKDWMLVAASDGQKVNAMTASWGGIGVMWGKNVAFLVIRPQRYTKELIDKSGHISLSFYGEEYRKMLNYMGTVSGREEDKIQKSGLHTVFDGETPYFEEARMVLITKKLFEQPYTPESFCEKELIEKWYPAKDYHTMYICEIEKVLVQE